MIAPRCALPMTCWDFFSVGHLDSLKSVFSLSSMLANFSSSEGISQITVGSVSANYAAVCLWLFRDGSTYIGRSLVEDYSLNDAIFAIVAGGLLSFFFISISSHSLVTLIFGLFFPFLALETFLGSGTLLAFVIDGAYFGFSRSAEIFASSIIVFYFLSSNSLTSSSPNGWGLITL